ncbi:MAG TPA: hypothetical protein ENN77_00545, partial [Candidatus Wirthbacteria bacterium]|nr:hypothetical protein [Candidatus Wirthbacteria bacterium]
YDSLGNTVAATQTTGNGHYTFNNIPYGTYTLVQAPVYGYRVVEDADSDELGIIIEIILDDTTTPITEQYFQNEILGGTISGQVFIDANGNGVQDGGETEGIENVTIRLCPGIINECTTEEAIDEDETDPSGYFALTAPTGSYTIYQVRSTLPAGYIATTSNYLPVFIEPGGSSSANRFGNWRPVGIAGRVFVDPDPETSWADIFSDELTALAGATVSIRVSTHTTSLATTTTDENGNYLFANLPYATYVVSSVDPYAYVGSRDADTNNLLERNTNTNFIEYVLLDDDDTTGTSITINQNTDETHFKNLHFAKVPLIGTISGLSYNDLNMNGVYDPDLGETGMEGITILLYAGDVNESNRGEYSHLFATVTGSLGRFTFTDIPGGNYTIYEDHASSPLIGYSSTTPDYISVSIAPGEASTAHYFGNTRASGTIAGYVYDDDGLGYGSHANGVRDGEEAGLNEVVIRLLDSQGNPVYSAPDVTIIDLETGDAPWGITTDGRGHAYVALSGTGDPSTLAVINGDTQSLSLPESIDYTFGENPIGSTYLNNTVYTTLGADSLLWIENLDPAVPPTAPGIGYAPLGIAHYDSPTTGRDRLYVANSLQPSISVFNASANTILSPINGITNTDDDNPYWLAVYEQTTNRGLIFITFEGPDIAVISFDLTGATDTYIYLGNIELAGTLTNIAVSQSSGRVFVANTTDDTDDDIYVFSTNLPVDLADTVVQSITLPVADGSVRALAADSSWHRVYAITDAANLYAYSSSSLASIPLYASADIVLASLPLTGIIEPRFMTVDPNTHRIYVSGYSSDNVALIDWGTTLTYELQSGDIDPAISIQDGYFEFSGIPAGNYMICQDMPNSENLTGHTNYVNTTPNCISVALLAGQTSYPHWFGNWVPGRISGNVWIDNNRDGLLDDGETSGLGGVTIIAERTDYSRNFGDPASSSVIPSSPHYSTTTDTAGYYRFDNLPVGTYLVSSVTPAGYLATGDVEGAADPNDPTLITASLEVGAATEHILDEQYFLVTAEAGALSG